MGVGVDVGVGVGVGVGESVSVSVSVGVGVGMGVGVDVGVGVFVGVGVSMGVNVVGGGGGGWLRLWSFARACVSERNCICQFMCKCYADTAVEAFATCFDLSRENAVYAHVQIITKHTIKCPSLSHPHAGLKGSLLSLFSAINVHAHSIYMLRVLRG